MTSGPFDPYYTWLGIPPEDQPPHHYRLLGLPAFETEREVIRNAADRQMSFVKDQALGERLKLSQRILKELAAARATLLNPQKKKVYDAELRKQLTPQPDHPGQHAPVTGTMQVDRLWVGVGAGTALLVGGLIGFLLLRSAEEPQTARANVAATSTPAELTDSDRQLAQREGDATSLKQDREEERGPSSTSNSSAESSAEPEATAIRLPGGLARKGMSESTEQLVQQTVAGLGPRREPMAPEAIEEGYVSSLADLVQFVPRATPAELQELDVAAQSGDPQSVVAMLDTFERLFDVSLVQQDFQARVQKWRMRAAGDDGAATADGGDASLESALASARSAIGRNDLGTARDILERTNREYVEDPRPSFLLGLLSVMDPETPITRSVGYFRATSRNIEQNAAVLNNYALCCLLAGDHSAAVAAWREVLAISPRERAVSQNLGKMLEDSRRNINGLPSLGLRDRTRESVQELYDTARRAGAPASQPGTGWLLMFLPESDAAAGESSGEASADPPLTAPAVFITPLAAIVRYRTLQGVDAGEDLTVTLNGVPARVLRRYDDVLFLQASRTSAPVAGWGRLVPEVGETVSIRLDSGIRGPDCKVVGCSKTGDRLILSCDGPIPISASLVVDERNRPIGYLTCAYSTADQAYGVVVTTQEILKGARISTSTRSRDTAAVGAADNYRSSTATIVASKSSEKLGVIGVSSVASDHFRVSSGYLEDLRCSHCMGASTISCRDRQCRNGTIKVARTGRRFDKLLNKYVPVTITVNEDCPKCQEGKIDCPFCTGGAQR